MKSTPIHSSHIALGAQMIQFAGWDMPAKYSSAIHEHNAVRGKVGMFDVSHMGRIYVYGPDALCLIDHLVTADVTLISEGNAKYCMACQTDGGILDDLIVYCLEKEGYLIVCNAGNRNVIWKTLAEQSSNFPNAEIYDRTTETAMIAVQGPLSISKLQKITHLKLSSMPLFSIRRFDFQKHPALGARTGYTGEDGAEIIVEAVAANSLWEQLLNNDVIPCGLVARDSLRLEAALRLWGNDINLTVNPLEAGLGRFVDFSKQEFTGKQALLKIKEEGIQRKLIGFVMESRGIPRKGHPILYQGNSVGEVTSGGYSPTLRKDLGLGFIPKYLSAIGTPLSIEIRGRHVNARVVSLPFYKR